MFLKLHWASDTTIMKMRRCSSPTFLMYLLLQANSATLKIKNQKNGRMGKTIHHESFGSNLYHRKALARRIHHILTNGGGTESYICEYMITSKDNFATVTPTDLITAIRLSVYTLKIHHTGINLDLVGFHSLRAGGGHVSEAARGKRHHHHENGPVVQPKISRVYSK